MRFRALMRRLCAMAVMAGAAGLVLTTPAPAQDLSPVNTFFTTIGDALTGTLGRAIGLVALAGVGVLFLTGRIQLMAALSIGLGLVIIYGAATILSGF